MIEIIRVSKRSNSIRVAMKGKKKLFYIPLFGQMHFEGTTLLVSGY